MNENTGYAPARSTKNRARSSSARANAGDADGLAALYEPGAILAGPGGQIIQGVELAAYPGMRPAVAVLRAGEVGLEIYE